MSLSSIAGEAETAGAPRPALYTGAVRRRLDPSLLVPSRLRGYAQAVGNIAALAVVFLLASRAHSGWQLVLFFVLAGLALHRLFFPVHDCIHYSLFPTKLENRIFGTLISGLLGTSFDAIRDQHMDHHRDFATPDDPGAPDYFVRFRSRGHFLRFVFGPLVGGILFSKLGDYLVRAGRAPSSTKSAAQKKASPTKLLFNYGVILAIQAGVCALLTSGFKLSELWRYPVFNVIPAVTIFLFLVRLRMFLEHGSLNYEVCDYLQRKRPTARTIYASWIERVLVCGSDFNFHHEHHLYPVVPGWQLPKLHRELSSSGLDSEDVRKTYVQAFREIWKNLGTAPVVQGPDAPAARR